MEKSLTLHIAKEQLLLDNMIAAEQRATCIACKFYKQVNKTNKTQLLLLKKTLLQHMNGYKSTNIFFTYLLTAIQTHLSNLC